MTEFYVPASRKNYYLPGSRVIPIQFTPDGFTQLPEVEIIQISDCAKGALIACCEK